MTQSSSFPLSARAGSGSPQRAAAPPASETPPDLPGCEAVRIGARELERTEMRLEFWHASTEIAWRVRQVHIYHEIPTQRLTLVVSRLASVRGSPIECFGSVSLVRREPRGRKRWEMQADQVVYLDPQGSRPEGPVIDVDKDVLPDVALEVDHTTDVRRWKLGVYKECGFPEIWVSVPYERSVRAPGLTIHLREGDVYRESPESRAFPGWRVEEIHRALTEEPLSTAAWRALERVGRVMGAREGTKPEDDPLTRSLSAGARAQGHAQGHAEGLADGRAAGCRAGRAEAVLAALRARGIRPSEPAATYRDLVAGHSLESLMAAALACTGEADFRRRMVDAST